MQIAKIVRSLASLLPHSKMFMVLARKSLFVMRTPRKIGPQAEYMHRIGLLKSKPASWKDVFFPEIHDLPGD